ncbi:hypothetical protein [Mesorhizobium sp. URHB0026]
MTLIFQHFFFNIKSLDLPSAHEFTPEYDPFRHVSSLSAHGAHENMATYTKLSSGSWRVQVRRKGGYVSETFLRRDDARRWATDAERQADRGETPTKSRIARLKTFGELIDLHIDDMCDVGKSPAPRPRDRIPRGVAGGFGRRAVRLGPG